MNIANSQAKTIRQILFELQQHYPAAQVRKPLLGASVLVIPYHDFKFLLRYKKTHLQLDFTPPVAWIIAGMLGSFVLFTAIYSLLFQQLVISIGGVIPVLIGLLLVKQLFKSTHKKEFDHFQGETNVLINTIIPGPGQPAISSADAG